MNCSTLRSMVPIATAENIASSFKSTCRTISSFTMKSGGLVTSKHRFSPCGEDEREGESGGEDEGEVED